MEKRTILLVLGMLLAFPKLYADCLDLQNLPPIEKKRTALIWAGCPASPTTFDILRCIIDEAGLPLDVATIAITTQPSHGVLINNLDGTVDYTPNSGFSGKDFFEFTIDDINGATSDFIRFTIYVRPVAKNDSLYAFENTIASVNVLGNDCGDFSNNGQEIRIQVVAAPTGGNLYSTILGVTPLASCDHIHTALGQSFYYRIDAIDPSGPCTDTFQYRIEQHLDDNVILTSNIATVTIFFAPIAQNDQVTTYYHTPINIDVLNNDSVPCADYCVRISTNPCHGSIEILPNNVIRYSPCEGFFGNDSFVYELCTNCQGDEQFCATATVNIKVLSCLQSCLAKQVEPCNNCH